MFFNKYFFAKVGRRKHTGKFLMLQFYKSLLHFYKKQENRPYTRLYGRFSYLRLSTYSSQSFRSEHCLRSRFAHSYITVISYIHYGFHSRGVLQCPSVRFSGVGPDQCGDAGVCVAGVGSSWAVLSMKTRISVDTRAKLWHLYCSLLCIFIYLQYK